ncbi:hypothetical protein POM88_050032 [Heracleum sosnowskyi]|uniref:Uncharacterized protein n=1 Tax=Heracleum sosnowskyi TaxID=360622 RepID=A0AAD8M136_9APIA|nr:hypothetical protein POM88_050032 [Heracleum sosnowskyi]
MDISSIQWLKKPSYKPSTWPRRLFTYRDIVHKNPKWIMDVITEFNNYYTHKSTQNEDEAYESIYKHVQSEIKHTLNEFWKELVEYWSSKALTHRSNVGSKNRENLKTLHSADAKSFTDME